MSTFFDENQNPEIVVGTQTIFVNPVSGAVTLELSGPVGPRGVAGIGEGGGPAALETHRVSATPHPVYDNMPSLSIIFENGLA